MADFPGGKESGRGSEGILSDLDCRSVAALLNAVPLREDSASLRKGCDVQAWLFGL